MEKYSCIIVEDEPIGAEIIAGYIEQLPFLHLVKVCNDAICASVVLQNEKIDLMFLDINLPRIKGIDFLKTLASPPNVIITTAYQEYALQGYEFNVLDYLLKPIEFNRFLTAVNKLKHHTNPTSNKNETEKDNSFLYFNTNKKKVKIFLKEILYIESQREYVKIYTTGKTIITKMPISQVDELLVKNDFLRIHRSFIISMSKIDALTATDVEINGKLIPIGRSYKKLVNSNLKQF